MTLSLSKCWTKRERVLVLAKKSRSAGARTFRARFTLGDLSGQYFINKVPNKVLSRGKSIPAPPLQSVAILILLKRNTAIATMNDSRLNCD